MNKNLHTHTHTHTHDLSLSLSLSLSFACTFCTSVSLSALSVQHKYIEMIGQTFKIVSFLNIPIRIKRCFFLSSLKWPWCVQFSFLFSLCVCVCVCVCGKCCPNVPTQREVGYFVTFIRANKRDRWHGRKRGCFFYGIWSIRKERV